MAIDATDTHLRLIDVSRAIGDIAQCNCHYTAMLSKIIDLSGRQVESMTIAELIDAHDECGKAFIAMTSED